MERARIWTARTAGCALITAGVLGLAGAAAVPAVAASPEAPDEPRVLVDAGPELRPAEGEATPMRQAADAGPRGPGATRIKRAHQKSLAGRTEVDFGSVIALCQEGISLGVSRETRKYALQLMSWSHNRRGELLAAAGHDEEAFSDFETAIHYDRTRWRSFHNRGVSYALEGDYKKAVADFNRTLELNPRFANAHFNRGEMHYELGEYVAAIQDYGRALELAPEDSAALNSRGHTHFQLGQYRQAIHDFTEAMRIDPKNAAPLTNRGDVFADLGYYAEALRDYRRSIGIDKSLGHTHQSIGWLVATCPDEVYRDEQLALSAAHRAIELDGRGNHRYLDTLAAAHAEAGNFRDAEKAVRQAIEIAPADDVDHYRNRLVLYERNMPYRSAPKKIAPLSLTRGNRPLDQGKRKWYRGSRANESRSP